MSKLLINAATSTAPAKQTYELMAGDFFGGVPALKAYGLGSGDSVLLWESINGKMQNTGIVLDSDTTSRLVQAIGQYAITLVMSTSGPVTVILSSVRIH